MPKCCRAVLVLLFVIALDNNIAGVVQSEQSQTCWCFTSDGVVMVLYGRCFTALYCR